MNRTVASLTAAAVAMVWGVMPAMSQDSAYKFDIGGSLGMSGYLGEANTANLLRYPGIGGGVSWRYLISPRMALKTQLGVASLRGDSRGLANVYPQNATYRFRSTVTDLSVRYEYHFFNYGIGEQYQHLRRLTPFMSAGLGLNVATCSGHTAVAPIVPLGLGVKYKAAPRVNFGVEFTMTKVVGDRIDGSDLKDLYGIKSSVVKNTDWYSLAMMSVSFEFGERCKTCYYVD